MAEQIPSYHQILLLAGGTDIDEAQRSGRQEPVSGTAPRRLDAASRRAVQLARAADARLEIFDPVCIPALAPYQTFEPAHQPVRDGILATRQAQVQALAANLAADLASQQSSEQPSELASEQASERPKVEAYAQWGDRVDRSVARRVLEREIDLVIAAGGAGAGGSGHDWRLVAMCPVPVLIVSQPDSRAVEAVPYRRVIAAVDPLHTHAKPAELDVAVLAHAHAVASLSGARLEVVHCYTPLTTLAAGLGSDPSLNNLHMEAQAALDASVRTSVNGLLEAAGIVGAQVQFIQGAPEAALNALAGDDADVLIVMGALARSGWKRLLIGSTAERFLRRAATDVLFVNPPGMSFAQ